MAKSQAVGRTRWKRFGVALVPATVVMSGLMAAAANGAIPMAFAVSGTAFKVKADRMVANQVTQYGSIAQTKNGDDDAKPVILSGFADATFTNLCQSVRVPLPFSIAGKKSVVLVIKSGGDSKAKNMVADLAQMTGEATFRGVDIGIDAKDTKLGPIAGKAPQNGMFAQQVQQVEVIQPRQTVYSVSAGEFSLPSLDLSVNFNNEECF